jgi:hypothetical protein
MPAGYHGDRRTGPIVEIDACEEYPRHIHPRRIPRWVVSGAWP